MGNEFAQGREWNHDASLDWHLLEGRRQLAPRRAAAGARSEPLTYRHQAPLHELDYRSVRL